MAGRTRLISVPPARGGDDRRGFRQLSGSMGATMVADPNASIGGDAPTDRFETAVVPDDDWARTIAQREAAEGLPTPVKAVQQSPWVRPAPHDTGYVPPATVAGPDVDLDGLPEKFTLEVESKPGGWWKVSAPSHHAGLFIAHQDLLVALTDAPGALAQILRLDGPVPTKRRRQTTKGNTNG